LVLVVATLVVFWQLSTHDFIVLDDIAYVSENPNVQKGFTKKSFIWAFTTFRVANWHPLTWLSHILDCQLFGLRPGMHHLTNLLFHMANSLILYLVLVRMTSARGRSAFVAALFALHPLHVESVAWVAERKDVLSTFFWMLTMWAYAFYAVRPALRRYLLVLFCYALGLMAKPMLVTLPFVLLLMDYWPLGRLQVSRWGKRSDSADLKTSNFRLILEKVPFFALTAGSSIVTFIAQQRGGAVASMDVIPLKMRMANGAVSYISYMGKALWPSNLGVFYPHPETSTVWQFVAAGLLLICLSAAFVMTSQKRPYLVVGWLWYLGTLVPVIGLIQVGTQAMADRYTYVPLIGLFILITWGVYDLVRRWHFQRIVLPLSAVFILLALMVCTWSQVRHWKNSRTLFIRTLNVTSNNWFVRYSLGVALYKEGKHEEAINHLLEALRIKTNYAPAHYTMGLALERQGKLEEAVSHFSEALWNKTDYVDAYYALGSVRLRQEKIDEAIRAFSKALRINPAHAQVYYSLGIALERQGRIEEAMRHYSEALQIKPDFPDAHNNLAIALERQGRIEEAISHYYEALRINPDYVNAHFNLGSLLMDQQRFKEAMWHYSEALRINPDYAKAHYNLGVGLMRQEKFDEAARHFSQALRINPDYFEAHYNLGVTLAVQGDRKGAAYHFSEVLRIKPDDTRARLALERVTQ
jgi:tetratricopeptide (TPR) repeat protein